ncbi:unnamed protein product [marine sediment metagenome]|uniref:Uncharacterized protein n=1 Tax=marine sediment metagenome TaxID=412755 RepID=X1R8S6_9ZZZZ
MILNSDKYINRDNLANHLPFVVAIDVLENILSKTIVSIISVDKSSTNLLNDFPVVADQYYFFLKIRLHKADATESYFMFKIPGDNAVYTFSSPVAIWNPEEPPAINYQKTWFANDLFCCGFSGGTAFDDGHVFGLKITTL